MERYWLAVLVVALLALSSASGAAFMGAGEELQCMQRAMYNHIIICAYEVDSSVSLICAFSLCTPLILFHRQQSALIMSLGQEAREL